MPNGPSKNGRGATMPLHGRLVDRRRLVVQNNFRRQVCNSNRAIYREANWANYFTPPWP